MSHFAQMVLLFIWACAGVLAVVMAYDLLVSGRDEDYNERCSRVDEQLDREERERRGDH